jgi:hypothetical protein
VGLSQAVIDKMSIATMSSASNFFIDFLLFLVPFVFFAKTSFIEIPTLFENAFAPQTEFGGLLPPVFPASIQAGEKKTGCQCTVAASGGILSVSLIINVIFDLRHTLAVARPERNGKFELNVYKKRPEKYFFQYPKNARSESHIRFRHQIQNYEKQWNTSPGYRQSHRKE